jgi:hypothetical protein
MKNRKSDKYELVTQTSYPPILKNRENGQEWVLASQTEIILSEIMLDLISRVELLEKRIIFNKFSQEANNNQKETKQ